ncbi:efflux RND transporter periplasmic adaptor subunit [Pseudomonas sessilinigenes]|uniref:Efflux RND transporter periplasmic adaptor subunit n=2 Tax=Pseudomonas TaxID=286 RepID=A0ABX8MJ96_9PSED|nr:efflux RND transporter periplasmic adaptor subunit [Pseudomonas sessilinigenes]QXH39382.1 efflux RND transporter periplasmic adaptor subunit [Pseudomonas sessilinigenes]
MTQPTPLNTEARMRPSPFYVIALALTLPLFMTACGPTELPAVAEASKPALTVSLATPTLQPVSNVISANGSVAAWQEAIIGPEINGLRVEEVLVQVGDRVRKGQPLARFARDTVENDRMLAEAALHEASAAAGEARADGQRARNLEDSGNLSAQRIQQLLTQEQTTQARLETARAQLALQKLRLSQTVLRAPDDGIVAARSATIGSVPAQGNEMFRLIRQGRLEWRAELAAQQLEQIRPGQKAMITSPGGSTWSGVVRLVAPTIDPSSRRGMVYVDIDSAKAGEEGFIPPGAYVSGELMTGIQRAMMVPQSAVVARDGFHLVFVVSKDMQVSALKVSVGRIFGDQQEVLSGLKGAERIVASGGAFLNNGDRVRLASSPANPDQH